MESGRRVKPLTQFEESLILTGFNEAARREGKLFSLENLTPSAPRNVVLYLNRRSGHCRAWHGNAALGAAPKRHTERTFISVTDVPYGYPTAALTRRVEADPSPWLERSYYKAPFSTFLPRDPILD